jgi:hypothetical protein
LHKSKTKALDLLTWRPRTPSIWTLQSTRPPAGNASPRDARSRTARTWLPRRPDEVRG